MTPSPDSHTPRAGSPRLAIQSQSIAWQALDDLVHRDPMQRGLASFRAAGKPLDAGQLRAAAEHLAEHATRVAIVTGFPVISGSQVVAETDGPPGALFLARALLAFGIDVALVTDRYGLPLVDVGCELWKLDRRIVVEFPFEVAQPSAAARARNDTPHEAATDRWVEAFLAGHGGAPWSHLVAVERPGPSHTLESLTAQARRRPAPVEQFLAEVPHEDRDACHNMRGQSINGHTAKAHRLFDEIARRQLAITTIGIGDGGNEIGMGRFPWETIVEAVGTPAAGRIACRVATDYALLAGISNWAAYALGLAVARLRGLDKPVRDWHAHNQRRLIETIVERTSAVDGVTLRREPTVDGLPLAIYLQTLTALASRLGYR